MKNNKNGFSLIKMIIVCLLIVFFIFLVMLLVAKAKKSSCDDINNSNSVFNNNMMYLQQVGSDFFNEDRLPKVVGETIKVTLAELIDGNYALDITDKNGKACDRYNSYVSVTKTETGYGMKTNLVCGTDSKYSIKEIVPCNCENKCTCEPIVENEFVKKTTKTVTKYTCSKGKLSGKNCVTTTLVDTKKPTNKTTTTTDTKPANKVVISGTKTKVDTETVDVPVDPIINKEADKTEKVCKTVEQEKTYDCNCTTYRNYLGKSVTTCSTCTTTIPVEKCDYVTTPGAVTKTCPKGAHSSGSGDSLKCWNVVTRCPSTSNYSEGSGNNLKCYVVTSGKYEHNCKGYNGYTLVGTSSCVKTNTISTPVCTKGYKLENNVCNKYNTTTKKAVVKKETKTILDYKWSAADVLKGYTKTGKTREVENKACSK